MFDVDRTRRVNVEGVNDLLQACVSRDVSRLIYASTYNVVFAGQEIESGDERLDYPQDADHPDARLPRRWRSARYWTTTARGLCIRRRREEQEEQDERGSGGVRWAMGRERGRHPTRGRYRQHQPASRTRTWTWTR